MPSVSVVMSVFNGEHFLAEAVESILAQSFSDFEFIIINDGSTDGTAHILDGYQNLDRRVHIQHQENRGLVESLNRGCALARGKYIARMDADDLAVKDRLQNQLSILEEQPEIAVLGGAIQTIDSTGKLLTVETFPKTDPDIKAALARGDCPLSHPTVVMKRECFVSVRGYRKVAMHAEDYDLWSRLSDRFRLANLEAVVLRYRRHPNQVSIRKCRQQALSALAARIAAEHRRNGIPDPLDSVAEITPATLITLGASVRCQESAIARAYVTCIRSMCEAGELSEAIGAIELGHTLNWKLTDKAVATDFRLLSAELEWRQKRFAQSMLTVALALIRRPTTIGRPLKPLLRRPQSVGPR